MLQGVSPRRKWLIVVLPAATRTDAAVADVSAPEPEVDADATTVVRWVEEVAGAMGEAMVLGLLKQEMAAKEQAAMMQQNSQTVKNMAQAPMTGDSALSEVVGATQMFSLDSHQPDPAGGFSGQYAIGD